MKGLNKSRSSNTPSHIDGSVGAVVPSVLWVLVLQVLAPHKFVVPGRVMFCKIIRHVERAFFPKKMELALLDAIFHPVKTHIEGFR